MALVGVQQFLEGLQADRVGPFEATAYGSTEAPLWYRLLPKIEMVGGSADRPVLSAARRSPHRPPQPLAAWVVVACPRIHWRCWSLCEYR